MAICPQNLYLIISLPVYVPIHILPIPYQVPGEGRQVKGEERKDHGRILGLVAEIDAANKTGIVLTDVIFAASVSAAWKQRKPLLFSAVPN